MAGDDDQFSFPVVSNQIPPHFFNSSSSLWRISSRVFHHGDDDYDYDYDYDVRSLADGASSLADEELRAGDSEERMDMLWEDFNLEETKERIKQAQLQRFAVTRRIVSKGRRNINRVSNMIVMVKLLKRKLHSIRQKSDRHFSKKDQ